MLFLLLFCSQIDANFGTNGRPDMLTKKVLNEKFIHQVLLEWKKVACKIICYWIQIHFDLAYFFD